MKIKCIEKWLRLYLAEITKKENLFMKNLQKLCSFWVIICLFVTGCGKGVELEQLEKENARLKEQLAVESPVKTENSEATPIISQPESSEIQTPAPTVKKLTKKQKYKQYAKQIKIKVYNKKVLPVNYDVGRYSEFIELDLKISNTSKKSIRGIKGTLYIYDQFEELILSINWGISEGTIGAGETKKVTNHGLDYNHFDDTHKKIYDLDYSDMIFKYEMEQVNFSDGYKLKF